MKLTNRFYNEERLRAEALDCIAGVSKEDALQWSQHPCTKTLKTALQSDMAGIINVWIDGGYSDEDSVDKTAQREAKARGMAQALDDVLETMSNISKGELEDDYTSGA